MEVKVTLRNPLDKTDYLDYYIVPNDTQLAQDWIKALKEILTNNLKLQKEFCFLGFPNTHRNLEYLCNELNDAITVINKYDFTVHDLPNYIIEDWFHPNVIRFPSEIYQIELRKKLKDKVPQNRFGDYIPREKLGLKIKQYALNQLHNHFERLEGTVENQSPYGQVSPPEVRKAIGALNHLCHEIESLVLSQRKSITDPDWVRPSQIMSFDHRNRYELTDEHRQGFLTNGYDHRFGHVYMHWTQIGKTLLEVFRDEGAPDLTDSVCEAITHLQYYSGEFDVEWAKDVVRNNNCPWHDEEQLLFENWLLKNGLDPRDLKLSLGFLHIGQVDLVRSFGTENILEIHKKLGYYLDVFKISVDGVSNTFDYIL